MPIKGEVYYQQTSTQESFVTHTGTNPFSPEQLYTPKGISPNAPFSLIAQDNLKIFDWMKDRWHSFGRAMYQWERQVNGPGEKRRQQDETLRAEKQEETLRYIKHYERYFIPNLPGQDGNLFLAAELAADTLHHQPSQIARLTQDLQDWYMYQSRIAMYSIAALNLEQQTDYATIVHNLRTAGIKPHLLWLSGLPDRSFDPEPPQDHPAW